MGGPDAVRIEVLAQTLGVSKGGFYWHFDDRRALLQEMLDTWERVVIDEAIERIEAGGGEAREKLRRLFALASSRQVKRPGAACPAVKVLSHPTFAAVGERRRFYPQVFGNTREVVTTACPRLRRNRHAAGSHPRLGLVSMLLPAQKPSQNPRRPRRRVRLPVGGRF